MHVLVTGAILHSPLSNYIRYAASSVIAAGHFLLAWSMVEFGNRAGVYPLAPRALNLYLIVSFLALIVCLLLVMRRLIWRPKQSSLHLLVFSAPFLLGVALQGTFWATAMTPTIFSPRIDPEASWVFMQLVSAGAIAVAAVYNRQPPYLVALAALHLGLTILLPISPGTPWHLLLLYGPAIAWALIRWRPGIQTGEALRWTVTSVSFMWAFGIIAVLPQERCQKCLPMAGALLPWRGSEVPVDMWSSHLDWVGICLALAAILILAAMVLEVARTQQAASLADAEVDGS